MISSIIPVLQDVDIGEKLENAPDSGYGVGVFIGSLLPFVLLVVFAVLLHRYTKKRIEKNDF